MIRKRITAPPKERDLTRLPDDAHIRTHEVARMTGYSHEYIRKKAKKEENEKARETKKEGAFAQPVGRTGEGPRGPLWFVIGDVRRYLRTRQKAK